MHGHRRAFFARLSKVLRLLRGGSLRWSIAGPDVRWRGDCSLHPNALSPWLPHHWLKGKAFLSGFGIAASTAIDGIDDKVVRILVDRLRHVRPPGDSRHARGLVLAFDKHYRPDGAVDDLKTGFYVSNDYVIELARRFPDTLLAAASIHPYRQDAIAELERVAAQGVRVIKWLPNVQARSLLCAACHAVRMLYGVALRWRLRRGWTPPTQRAMDSTMRWWGSPTSPPGLAHCSCTRRTPVTAT